MQASIKAATRNDSFHANDRCIKQRPSYGPELAKNRSVTRRSVTLAVLQRKLQRLLQIRLNQE